MKNVQISEELFVLIVKAILLDSADETEKEAICKGLSDKLDAMIRQDLYTKYKTGATLEEREKARQEYLDMIGMRKSFRY